MNRLRHGLYSIVGTVAFVAAAWLIVDALAAYRLEDIVAEIRDTSARALGWGLLFTAASYYALCYFDVMALHAIGIDLPFRRTALASFVSHGVSHTAGLAVVSGGSVRYRFYSAWGLTPLQVATVIVLCGIFFASGATFLGGLVLTFEPHLLAQTVGLPVGPVRAAGLVLLAAVAAYVAQSWFLHRPLVIHHVSVKPARPKEAVAHIVVASLDLAAASAVLYAVLPPEAGIGFLGFFGIYLTALIAGLLSHVPGGLGVFEGVLLLLLPGDVSPPAVIGSLLLYRALYNLVPLVLALAWFALYEVFHRRSAVHQTRRRRTEEEGEA